MACGPCPWWRAGLPCTASWCSPGSVKSTLAFSASEAAVYLHSSRHLSVSEWKAGHTSWEGDNGGPWQYAGEQRGLWSEVYLFLQDFGCKVHPVQPAVDANDGWREAPLRPCHDAVLTSQADTRAVAPVANQPALSLTPGIRNAQLLPDSLDLQEIRRVSAHQHNSN